MDYDSETDFSAGIVWENKVFLVFFKSTGGLIGGYSRINIFFLIIVLFLVKHGTVGVNVSFDVAMVADGFFFQELSIYACCKNESPEGSGVEPWCCQFLY